MRVVWRVSVPASRRVRESPTARSGKFQTSVNHILMTYDHWNVSHSLLPQVLQNVPLQLHFLPISAPDVFYKDNFPRGTENTPITCSAASKNGMGLPQRPRDPDIGTPYR